MKNQKPAPTIDLTKTITDLGYHFLLCGIFGHPKPQVKFRNANDLALAVIEGSLPCLLSNEAIDAINAALETLTPREITILQRRCAFGNYDLPQTLQEIVDDLGITKSRIRAIEAHAYQKLRHPTRSEKLRDIPVIWANVFSRIAKLENELKKSEAQFNEFAARMNTEMGKYREAAAAAANILFPLTQDSAENSENPMGMLLRKPLSNFKLSVRAQNCLKLANIETLGDLASKTEAEMLRIRNLGRHALNELKQILTDHGLSFGMTIS